MDNVRYCGKCTLCCLVLDIEELNKKAGEWCAYCTAEGCDIYEERPEACRGFHCLWQLMGVDEDKGGAYRPDRLGVVMIHKEEIEGYSPAVQFNGVDKRSLADPRVTSLANALAKSGKFVGLVSIKGDMDSKLLIPN